MTNPTPLPEGNVTIREVYHLLNTMRAELKSELQALGFHVDKKFDDHEVEHTQIEAKYDRGHQRVMSMLRWAVTTILTSIGVAVAIYVAVK